MKLELLNKLITLINKTKCDIIVIEGNMIYATDSKYSILKTIEIPYTDIIIATSLDCIKWSIENNQEHPNLFVHYCYTKIHYLINRIVQYQQLPMTVNENDIRQNEDFEMINQYKASDGVMIYRTNRYCISIYKSLLNLNKPDKVNIKIYDNILFFLSHFTIIKKDCTINLYMECRKI